MEQTAERRVIIVAEKLEKRERIKRALTILFNTYDEEVQWIEAKTPDEAVDAVDRVLVTVQEIQETMHILIATAGLNGRWFEAPGHAKLKEAESKGKIVVQAILMGGTDPDVKEARQEGIDSVVMTVSDEEIATLVGQILFGETAFKNEAAVGGSEEPHYEVFQDAP